MLRIRTERAGNPMVYIRPMHAGLIPAHIRTTRPRPIPALSRPLPAHKRKLAPAPIAALLRLAPTMLPPALTHEQRTCTSSAFAAATSHMPLLSVSALWPPLHTAYSRAQYAAERIEYCVCIRIRICAGSIRRGPHAATQAAEIHALWQVRWAQSERGRGWRRRIALKRAAKAPSGWGVGCQSEPRSIVRGWS